VTLRNDAGGPALCVLEKVQWDDRVVTAAAVTALQKFRDLFSSEVLAPGQQIGVRNLCVLFTDLKKSTELYEMVGDASAFARVIRHFDYITEHVAKHRGSLVKTIGDAVMAVFPSPLTAVQACIEMQAGLDTFNREQNLDPPLVLKMGVHFGSAIAVNANGVLDYFGRTVNFAARVQAESEGGDVVLSAAVSGAEGVSEWLAEQPLDVTEYTVRLKGFEDAVKLRRVLPKAAVRRSA
jgi:class 3 adenylate cyclase